MRRDELLSAVEQRGLRLFTTTDAAVAAGVTKAHASIVLSRISSSGAIGRLARGRWAILRPASPHPLAAAAFLAAPRPVHVTGPSALHHHGVLAQVPRETHLGWTSPPRAFRTPIGSVRFHHLPVPREDETVRVETPDGPVRVATPEKALVETAYLDASSRSDVSLFPELNIEGLDRRTVEIILGRIENPAFRERVRSRLAPVEKRLEASTRRRSGRVAEARRDVEAFVERAGGWARVGLFVGAGYSNVFARLPDSRGFLQEVGMRLKRRGVAPDLVRSLVDSSDDADHPELLEQARTVLGEDAWRDEVQSILAHGHGGVGAAALAARGTLLHLTTNLDGLLESNLATGGGGGRGAPVAVWPSPGVSPDEVFASPGPIVVHLHGRLDDQTHWVLTSRDYRRAATDGTLTRIVETALLDRPFLFIGYGLRGDQHLLRILERLQVRLEKWNHEHVALLPEDELEGDDGRAADLRSMYGIRAIGIPRKVQHKSGLEFVLCFPSEKKSPEPVEGEPPWRRALLARARHEQAERWWKWSVDPIVASRWTARALAAREGRKVEGVPPIGPGDIELREELGGAPLRLRPAEILRLHRVLLVGDFGVGKTTYLRKLFADQDPLTGTPMVLVPLRSLGDGKSLVELIREETGRASGVSATEAAAVLHRFVSAKGCFLLDGIDELGERRHAVLAEIASCAADWPGCGLILTTRPEAESEAMKALASVRPHVLDILPFSQRQVEDYCRRRVGDERPFGRLHTEVDLDEILQVPAFLDYACEALETGALPIPFTIGRLLDRLLARRLAEEKAQGRLKIEAGKASEILRRAAFALQRRDRFELFRDEWFEALREPIRAAAGPGSGYDERELFEALVHATLLVVDRGRAERYSFQHRIWQNHLAGAALAELNEEETLKTVWRRTADDEGIDPRWYLTLRMAAEASRPVHDLLWSLKDRDPRAVSRILPCNERETNRWAFDRLLGEYLDEKKPIRTGERAGHTGLDDDRTLVARAKTLGTEAESRLEPLLVSKDPWVRSFSARIAWEAKLRDLLDRNLANLLGDADDDVRGYAARASLDLGIGDSALIVRAVEQADEGAFDHLFEALQKIDPEAARRISVERFTTYLRSKDSVRTYPWAIQQLGSRLLSEGDLGTLAGIAMETGRHVHGIPASLVERAAVVRGEGGLRLLAAAHLRGVRRELQIRPGPDPSEKILNTLKQDRSAGGLALAWAIGADPHPGYLPFHAVQLLAGMTPKRSAAVEGLLFRRGVEECRWLGNAIVEAYRQEGKVRIGRAILRAHGLPLPVRKSERERPPPRLRRPARPTLAEIVRRIPHQKGPSLLALFDEDHIHEVAALPKNLAKVVHIEVERVLAGTPARTAVRPEGDRTFHVNNAWRAAVSIVERIGPKEFSATSVAGLAEAQEWTLFVAKVLEMDDRPEVLAAIRDAVRPDQRPDALRRALQILKARGVPFDEVLRRLGPVDEAIRRCPEIEKALLAFLKDDPSAAERHLDPFLRSAHADVRYVAAAIRIRAEGARASVGVRKGYIGALREILHRDPNHLHFLDPYRVRLPVAGIERRIGAFCRWLLKHRAIRNDFFGGSALNWAIEHLRSAETDECLRVLGRLRRRFPDAGWLAGVVDDARLIRLARAGS